MKRTRETLLWVPKRVVLLNILVFLAVLSSDQLTKFNIAQHFSPGESRPFLGPWVDLTYSLNPGAAFGWWKESPAMLAAFAFALIVILGVWLVKLWRNSKASGLLSLGVALVFAGAVGNEIDRLRLGVVVDFIDLKFWPVFNIADSAITLGALIIILQTVSERRRRH